MKATFWENGIRFECQGTGRCCTSYHEGKDKKNSQQGYVYLTLLDRQRLAKNLGISTLQFTKRYCEKTDGYFHLKNPNENCQFLRGKACSVYEGRPTQCRTWPFWPENMNARTWNEEVIQFCPGVGKGRLYSKTEIQSLLQQDPLLEA